MKNKNKQAKIEIKKTSEENVNMSSFEETPKDEESKIAGDGQNLSEKENDEDGSKGDKKGRSKKNKKKTLLKIVVVLLVIFGILEAANLILPMFREKVGFTKKHSDIFYFPEDYSENIFDDLVYMNKNRDVKFGNVQNISVYVTEENYSSQSPEAKLFYDYFQSLINGRYDEHKNFFTKSFFEKYTIPKKFTMQKIYDIEISIMGSESKNGIVYETYKVGYKIYKNNGSYRADIGSIECKPVAITIEKGKERKISSIVPILEE